MRSVLKFLEKCFEVSGMLALETEESRPDHELAEAGVVVDALERDAAVLAHLNQVVLAVAVALSGNEVEPLEAVRLAHEPADDLRVLRVVEVADLAGGQAVGSRLDTFPEQFRLHAGGLLHEQPELAAVRADGRLRHHVAQTECVSRALRGHVELCHELIVLVGAL